ncbi:hypothetical protein NDU88_002050 [Pleurodeles waltl]|uniref:Uncharacterized protein n=1 Tax=Pleurodeles waltl TaxID=8319 RepID=A0AAV7NGJ0_PLEWA|nr:hypothetical protein NDU88_002050 [Pleurodeles waltl]
MEGILGGWGRGPKGRSSGRRCEPRGRFSRCCDGCRDLALGQFVLASWRAEGLSGAAGDGAARCVDGSDGEKAQTGSEQYARLCWNNQASNAKAHKAIDG